MYIQTPTPDTSGYMIAGYVIAFAVMGIYVASLYLRSRNLRQDQAMLEEMEKPSARSAPRQKPSSGKKQAKPAGKKKTAK